MECSICFREYDDQILPMTGTCGHSFCKDCVKRFIPKCPTCQRRSFLHPRKNFLAIEMIEFVSKSAKDNKEIKAYQERLDQCTLYQREQDKKLEMLVPTVKDLQDRLAEKSSEKTAAYQILGVYNKKIESQDSQILKLNKELFEKTLESFEKDRYIQGRWPPTLNTLLELEQKLKMVGVEAEYNEVFSPEVKKPSQSAEETLKDQSFEESSQQQKNKRRADDDEPSARLKRYCPEKKGGSVSSSLGSWSIEDALLFHQIVRGQVPQKIGLHLVPS